MKKIKKLISILSISLISFIVLGFSACNTQKPNNGQTADYVESITLKNEQLIVGLYMTAQIEYQEEGIATYVSDKPDIVSVDATGKITGLKEGTAIITVTVGKAKAVCEVSVVNTNDVPYIQLAIEEESYNLMLNDYIDLDAKLIFVQEERNEKISYVANNDCVSFDENGRMTAKKVGTSVVTVSAEFFGKTISRALRVNVFDSSVELNASTSNYVVYTNASKGHNDSVALPNSIIEDGEVKPVEFTYLYDTSKLISEGNVFKAKLPCFNDEVINVQLQYTTSEQVTYTFNVEVQIQLVHVDMKDKVSLAIENGTSQAVTGRGMTLVYNEEDISGNIVAVYESGTDLQYNTQTKEIETKVDIASSSKWDLITDNGLVYNVPIEFYDVVLYNGTDFKEILPKVTSEYVVLGNDIEKVEGYKGSYRQVVATLDGRGHSVKEITYAGYDSFLFGYFAGTIKNISFDDMLLIDRQYGIAEGALSCTLENVFIDARYKNVNGNVSVATLFKEIWGGNTITLNNVVVIFNSPAELGLKYSIVCPTSETKQEAIDNSRIVCTNVYTSGTVNGENVFMAPENVLGIIAGGEYKTEADLWTMANSGNFTDMLNKAVLANTNKVVDKTATQSYYVENWTTEGVTLTNAHNKPVFVAHDNLSDRGSKSIQKIMAGNVNLGYNAATGELDASKLTKGTAFWNVYYSNTEIYKVTVNVVDAIIKDATDFKEILPKATTEYIVLGNDIEKVEGYPHAFSSFSGTLDGCGYSVGEISYNKHPEWYVGGWLFSYFSGTIKNIRFDNMQLGYTQNGIADAVNGYATLENVFINATSTQPSCKALFGDAWGDYRITLNNVVVIFDTTGTSENYSIIGTAKSAIATNVYVSGVLGDGNAMPMSPSGDIAGCAYKTKAELLAMANAGDVTLTDMAKVAIKEAIGE